MSYKHGKQIYRYTNMQQVFNHYKAVARWIFFKSWRWDLRGKKQAAKGALSGSKLNYEKMKAIARPYATERECSVQEVVYLVMPELWLHKIFLK